MNTLWKIDAWIMAKHQWVADRVYSRFGMSPYKLAANIWGALIIIEMLDFSIYYQANIDGPSVSLFMKFIGIPIYSAWFWLAILREKSAKNNQHKQRGFIEDIVRLYLVITLLIILPIVLHGILSGKDVPYLTVLSVIFGTSAFYFYGCDTPTFIERKEHKLVPATEGA